MRATVARDDAIVGRLQVTLEECHLRSAMEQWRTENADALPMGALVGVEILPEGREPVDPLKKAGEADHASLLARFPHLRAVRDAI